jgi:hypothetical protein
MSGDQLNDAPKPPATQPFRSEFQPLIDELYREEVLEARRMSPEEKFLAGEELFQYACSITLAGIRSENPGFSEADCRHELERRLELRERMDQHDRANRPGGPQAKA